MFKRQRNGQGDGPAGERCLFLPFIYQYRQDRRDLCRIGRMGRIGTLSLWYNWILLSCRTVTYDTE